MNDDLIAIIDAAVNAALRPHKLILSSSHLRGGRYSCSFGQMTPEEQEAARNRNEPRATGGRRE